MAEPLTYGEVRRAIDAHMDRLYAGGFRTLTKRGPIPAEDEVWGVLARAIHELGELLARQSDGGSDHVICENCGKVITRTEAWEIGYPCDDPEEDAEYECDNCHGQTAYWRLLDEENETAVIKP